MPFGEGFSEGSFANLFANWQDHEECATTKSTIGLLVYDYKITAGLLVCYNRLLVAKL